MYMSSLGQNLKLARSRAGFTQKEVESKLGLRSLSLKDYETERIKLPASLGITLAKLYGVTIDVLLGNKAPSAVNLQELKLAEIGQFFSPSEASLLYMDPVIRAYLEDYRDELLDRSTFDLLTSSLSVRQRLLVAAEILHVLASLMGVDEKITDQELHFLRRLIAHFGFDAKAKSILKSAATKVLPSSGLVDQKVEIRHFILWLLFFIAKSDGEINNKELDFIELCAETMRINRSNFLYVQKFFVKEKV